MEPLSYDPELAPDLIKLLNAKVQELRKGLEDSRKHNEMLSAQLAQGKLEGANGGDGGRAGVLGNDALSAELATLRSKVDEQAKQQASVSAENRRLHEEIDRLRSELEAARTAGLVDEEKPLTSCLRRLCPARNDVRDLQKKLQDLERHHEDHHTAVQAKEAEYKAEIERLKAVNEQSEAFFQKTVKRRDYYKQELACARDREHEHILTIDRCRVHLKNFQVRNAALEKAARERGDWESDVSEEEADEEDHYHSARDSEENEEPEEDADDEDAENDHDQESLDRPDNVTCICRTRNPHTLSARVRKLSTATGAVLFWPGRTLWPLNGNKNAARILAARSRCDTSASPLAWTPAGHDLAQFAGGTHELFVRTPAHAVCYAGTFRCVRAAAFSAAQFRRLDKKVREGVVAVQCVGGAAAFGALAKADKDRIRNRFACGQAEVEYVDLEFEAFNGAYFDEMLRLKEDDERQAAAKKRKLEDQDGGQAKKRARK